MRHVTHSPTRQCSAEERALSVLDAFIDNFTVPFYDECLTNLLLWIFSLLLNRSTCFSRRRMMRRCERIRQTKQCAEHTAEKRLLKVRQIVTETMPGNMVECTYRT